MAMENPDGTLWLGTYGAGLVSYNPKSGQLVIYNKENEGGHFITNPQKTDASLEIQLKEFKLDIVKRKWILRMSYQAGLSKNSGQVAKESVNGSAERLKVMGKSDAEKILGELVTDMVNKLDVANLFKQIQP